MSRQKFTDQAWLALQCNVQVSKAVVIRYLIFLRQIDDKANLG